MSTLFSVYGCINYLLLQIISKCSDLKQHTFIIPQFPRVGNLGLVWLSSLIQVLPQVAVVTSRLHHGVIHVLTDMALGMIHFLAGC